MKYISIREFFNQKLLGELSNGARPLGYATILKYVREHIESGNEAKVIEIGEGKSVRYAVPVMTVDKLSSWITSKY